MIQINNVWKTYGGFKALSDINFEVPDGQVVGLLGENGAGKTTLLKAMVGLIKTNQGEVEFNDIKSQKEKCTKIAYVTEEGSFFPFLSVKQNAEFFADYYEGFQMERFSRLIDFFDLQMGKKARTLSKGEKAKLEMALGFSKGGKYLLLDEPFLGNDVFTRRDFLRLMCDSLVEDETIIIATHLIDEIENFIDRAVFLQKGRIKGDVDIEEIQKNGITLEEKMREVLKYDEERFNKALA